MILYRTLEYQAKLPDGRVITRFISDPKGISVAERIEYDRQMQVAFKDYRVNGIYKASIFR